MLQLHLSDQHFYCLIRCAYIRGLVVVKDCFYRCLKMTPTLSPVKCLTFRSLVQRMFMHMKSISSHNVAANKATYAYHEWCGLFMISSNRFQPLSDDLFITASISLQLRYVQRQPMKSLSTQTKTANHIVRLFQFMSGNAENVEHNQSGNLKKMHKIHIQTVTHDTWNRIGFIHN